MQYLPVCNTKMPSITIKHMITVLSADADVDIDDIPSFITCLLEAACHAVVVDEKEIVFSYYNPTQSFRKQMLDRVIHRELIEHSVHVLQTCKTVDLYMKYDDTDSWRVRISDNTVSYFCAE